MIFYGVVIPSSARNHLSDPTDGFLKFDSYGSLKPWCAINHVLDSMDEFSMFKYQGYLKMLEVENISPSLFWRDNSTGL